MLFWSQTFWCIHVEGKLAWINHKTVIITFELNAVNAKSLQHSFFNNSSILSQSGNTNTTLHALFLTLLLMVVMAISNVLLPRHIADFLKIMISSLLFLFLCSFIDSPSVSLVLSLHYILYLAFRDGYNSTRFLGGVLFYGIVKICINLVSYKSKIEMP